MSLGLIITGVICVLLILVIYISTSKNRKKSIMNTLSHCCNLQKQIIVLLQQLTFGTHR